MADTFITIPIETDPDVLAQEAYTWLEGVLPGWLPTDGQLDAWLIAALARIAAEIRDVASDVPPAIFRYFGSTLLNLPPLAAVPATVLTTWTAIDTLGHTIPAGSVVGVRDSAGNLFAFATLADVTIPNGSSTVAAVTVNAVIAGVDSSGLGAPAAAMELISSLDFISGVTQAAATAGGQDAEADSDYLNRLSADLALQAPRPILPNDFAIFARNTAGVGRALALDGYDAVALTFGNARTITVAVVDSTGATVSAPIKAAVLASLQSQREVNFLVYVIDPTFTTIDVNVNVSIYPGFQASDVIARVQAAIQAYLSPASWGQPQYTSTALWVSSPIVKINDLIGIAYKQTGVKDVNSVTARVSPASFAATDINLTGAAPLTRAGVITPTVT